MASIVIIGGGIMGSSIAYYLARAGAAADTIVVEPDPTYTQAASPRAVGGVRRLFGIRENVQMSQYGREVYTSFDKAVNGAATTFDPAFRVEGYSFLVWGAPAVAALEANTRMQRDLGVPVEMLDRGALKSRYPSFNFEAIDAAALCAGDGKVDPNAALMGFRRCAEARGIAYLKDRVVDLGTRGAQVTEVRLASGKRLAADIVVNAANCWAPDICAMVGMTVPIEPLRRQMFFFHCATPLEKIPAMRDMSAFGVRPEGDGYLTGVTKFREASGFNWELEHSLFEEELWPRLAERCSAFEAVKMRHGWVGHYDMCRFDGNPIIGPWTGRLENFILVAGFSGHGLQHAPAVGRGVKELLLDGGYRTIDLSVFSYQRVLDNRPLADHGPTA